MSSPLPPDPYAALGVPKTADLQTIKSTYRKLVLKCHPDKFPDESLKAQKQEEFQKIQQAYELIGDENARSRYDAQVHLAELRREGLEKHRRSKTEGAGGVETRAGYKVRTAEPSAAFYSRTASTPESKPTRAYEESADRYFEEQQRASSRKYDGYESYSRRSPRADREERNKTEKKKTTRDRDERRERTSKYSTYAEEDDSDNHARYDPAYLRRSNESERARETREALRKKTEELLKEEQRRSAEEKAARESRRKADYASEGYERKLREREADVRNYIERTRAAPHDDSRPPMPPRMSSNSSSQFYELRRPGEKPIEVVRRSRASKERKSSRDRERKYYQDIVDPSPDWKPPTLEKSHSTPANIKVTRVSPQRTTSHAEYENRTPPRLSRSETEPARRKDVPAAQPSKLRETAVPPHDSGYSSPSSATTPEAQYPTQSPPKSSSTTRTYRYTAVPASTADKVDFTNGHRTVLCEPERYRTRSPSPLTRTVRPSQVPPSGVRYTSATTRPPIPHANSSARMEDLREERERGRDRSSRPLYGETTHSAYRRSGERPSVSSSYKPEDVRYAPSYSKDDVQFSRGYTAGFEAGKKYRDRSWDDDRPKMGGRSTTTVF